MILAIYLMIGAFFAGLNIGCVEKWILPLIVSLWPVFLVGVAIQNHNMNKRMGGNAK